MGNELTGTQKQRSEKEKNRRDRLASFFYDLAKLVFAATILANVAVFMSPEEIKLANVIVIVCGALVTCSLATIANRILTY